MKNHDYEKLYAEFLSGREKILSDHHHDQKDAHQSHTLAALLAHTRSFLSRLRDDVVTRNLATLEEIQLFKFHKPRLYRWLIYDTELFAIARQVPPESKESAEAYYHDQLHYFSLSLKQYDFLYHYYRLNATELDNLYFVRDVRHDGVLSPVLPDPEHEFSTGGDYLFARFMATELLIDEIKERMARTGKELQVSKVISKKGRSAKWTGEACNLVEVIYGMIDTGQINDGKMDIQELADIMEQVFDVNLSRYARTFNDIKQRKAVSQTRYLNEMRDAVQQRIDDGNAYVPMSMKSK